MAHKGTKLGRRIFLIAGVAALAGGSYFAKLFASTLSGPVQSQDVSIEEFSAAGKSEGIVRVAKIVKTDARVASPTIPGRLPSHAPGRYRVGFFGRVRQKSRERNLSLHLLRHGPVRLPDEVRLRYRMAELLAGHLRGERREEFRFEFRHAARRRFVPALRCAFGACVR